MNFEDRRHTFSSFTEVESRLCEAGFYLAQDSVVQCFSCNGKLSMAEATESQDDCWAIHAK